LGEELTVEQLELPIANLHPSMEGYRVVQLSDMHLYPFTRLEFIRQAVEAANALKPDLIVMTGDYVSHTAEAIHDLEHVISHLNARDGVYATLGNHDHWTSARMVRAGLRSAGLSVLHNQSVPLQGGRLWLTGLDDGWVGRADLDAALEQATGDAPAILLMHEPDLVDIYSQNPRIALQLSGHTHGGQIRLMRPRRAYTLPYLGRKYDQGLYRVNNTWLYTNRGIGTVIAPIRFNCPAEVTEFTLVSGPPPAEFLNPPLGDAESNGG
jgi:predicted MPP superfamily phosphohydrolase